MTYGAIVRADSGGIGNQTAEICRHVPPAKALIVDVGEGGRGAYHPERFGHIPEVRVNRGDRLSADNLAWLCDGVSTVFTVECGYLYHPDSTWVDVARFCGTRTVLQANAELWRGEVPDLLVPPTDWEIDRFPPGTEVLPVPVARDRLPERPHSGKMRTLYHPASPAMLDRNGTQLLLEAAQFCATPFRVLIRGYENRTDTVTLGRCTVSFLPPVVDYWEQYPDEADALVLPRRYGGLSLGMQEAASLGWPIVTLGVAPQSGWLPTDSLVAAYADGQPRRMVGGRFQLWACDPPLLARRLDDLARSPERVDALSAASLAWAESLAWRGLVDRYRSALAA